MRFGVSTHLYHDEQLSEDHLAQIAKHGFDAIELFATRTHFDYHNAATIETLERWLKQTGLTLYGIHAPIVVSLRGGVWGPPFSTATLDTSARSRAIREAEAALEIARRIPTSVFVVHLGVPKSQRPDQRDNSREAARQSVEELFALTSSAGVRLALEVIPNELSTPTSLVDLLDECDCPTAGICMDVGHAFLLGDLAEAIEITAGHIITTHIHDNHGRSDDHLVPFDGRINWPEALMTLQKIGYEGTLLLELGNTSSPPDVLAKARGARARIEAIVQGQT